MTWTKQSKCNIFGAYHCWIHSSLCGFVTFFIIKFYWAQQFPIELYLQFLSVLSLPDSNLSISQKKMSDENQEKVIVVWREVVQHVNIIDFKNVLINEMAKQDFVRFNFPFRNPWLIMLCIIYAALFWYLCLSKQCRRWCHPKKRWLNYFLYLCGIILGDIANMHIFDVVYLI